ncbi:LysR family transcriptional regulator [Pluralibacter gergoviae]|uniref:LysR family transcriptional regulator n=1 Tax=Pluralibacter gergoviae TaxID=61647 RepID=UPI000BFC397E|nr:LysR family transcriptional regulator [Pluralibacter gergoviae]ELG9928503.1 LysR family transcriptional regulator [Pluralibacter gergoviae]ELK5593823.1 LysR family transcriptional regulator [Pluralibacter gergoviae]MCK1064668.1 LysR family transcriptional regulator [Pluralibacter gergoviae]MCV7759824.1 LysR family transcriptional regulator [Pluralibacter gergoviae]PHH48027.1 LysR family transcriptional regulator [Pluralibacter gergoviae]
MEPLHFTLAQIEAFTCVCESGTLTQAARRLKKDRTTVSELVDYLEVDLGYPLFERRTRPLTLTPQGQLLYRQARLFLHEAEAFSRIAGQIPARVDTHLTLCYDLFTPRRALLLLTQQLAQQHIHLDLIACERAEAEKGLNDGSVDIAVFQALNRTVNDSLHWRAVGSVSLAVYAREEFFEKGPVSLLHLASKTQLMPFRDLPPALAARLQIADRIARVNEISLLESLLQSGCGWAFLPDHFNFERLEGVGRVETEMGEKGLTHPLVALWKPGRVNAAVLAALERCI